jgi:thiamine-phosphate diphosphorylase
VKRFSCSILHSCRFVSPDHPDSNPVAPGPNDKIPVLHAVTSDDIVMRSDFVDRARRVMHAGGSRVAVHVRASKLNGRRLHELACRIADLQPETGAWLIVNERADVALTSGARGVQLTSRSMSPFDARGFVDRLWVGASVHSEDDARRANDAGSHWIVAGHSADGSAADGVAFIQQLAAHYTLPIIAIGGVRPEHVPALRKAGAHGVAVIRGVWHANDAGAAVIDYLSAHGTYVGE